MNLNRIIAYNTRHIFLFKRSLPRLMEIFYWPDTRPPCLGLYKRLPEPVQGGAAELYRLLSSGRSFYGTYSFSSQQGISVSFLEDMWSRNLLNVFVSPISATEYVCSLLLDKRDKTHNIHCRNAGARLATLLLQYLYHRLRARAARAKSRNNGLVGGHNNDEHNHALRPGGRGAGLGNSLSLPARKRGLLSGRDPAGAAQSQSPPLYRPLTYSRECEASSRAARCR